MPPTADHPCVQEKRITTIEATFEYFVKRTGDHIHEGEKQGGHRDRLILAEKDIAANTKQIENLWKYISALKKGYWKACLISGLIGGIIGGLLGKVSPDFFNLIVRVIK